MGAVSVSHDCPALEERTRLVNTNTPSDTAVCDVCKLGRNVLRRTIELTHQFIRSLLSINIFITQALYSFIKQSQSLTNQ